MILSCRTRDKDRNRDSRERSRDRHDGRKDKQDKDKKDKKDRDSHRDRDYKPYQHSDSYESPPGIYDSPSDEEYGNNRYTHTGHYQQYQYFVYIWDGSIITVKSVVNNHGKYYLSDWWC